MAQSPRTRSLVRTIIAVVLAATVVAPASAHDLSVTVDADHAYAGDPLGSRETGAGLFPGRLPDQLTAMGSTTKIMTLIVALDAISAGVVDLDDIVTISFAATTPGFGSSLMTDDNGISLQVGERVRLEDLLFGLIIDSGNDAAIAIAEHVAAGYLGSLGTVGSFVALMNAKAAALGLSSTVFSNPSGIDATPHFTTARELAQLWEHGMTLAEFRRIVRPQTWIAQGTFLGSTVIKTYTMRKSGGYPGIEGHKNGKTPNCSGADTDDQCFVGSARRIGRRIVVAGMQSDGVIGGTTGDAADVWDFAFNRLFHPNARGSSALGDVVSRLDLVCPGTNRAVTVSVPAVGRPVVTAWSTNVATQSYAVQGRTTFPTSALAPTASAQDRDVDVLALSSGVVVTATRVGTSGEIRAWSVPSSGAPTQTGNTIAARTVGSVRSLELVRLTSSVFAAVSRTADDLVRIQVYRRTTKGITLVRSTSLTASIGSGVTEVEATAGTGLSGSHLVTVARRTGSLPIVHVWRVDLTTGALTGGPSATLASDGSTLRIAPAPVEALPGDGGTPDLFYAIAVRRTTGNLALSYARVNGSGRLVRVSAGGAAGGISDVELASFGTSGLVTLVRLGSGNLKPIVWETYRDPDLSQNPDGDAVALRISDHATSINGLGPEICSTPTATAEGHFISGLREGSTGAIRLRGWEIAARP